MNASTDFGRSLIGLLVKRLHWLVAFAVIGALLGYVGTDQNKAEGYEARTLVVAKRWEQRIESLSRLVETVIQTGNYQEQLRSLDEEAFPASTTFDRTVDVVPVQDTVAVWVEATASTPELAQRRANTAAVTLVVELNRLGQDIGVFTVQDRARVPNEPIENDLDPVMAAALGALAGLILASGLSVAWPAPAEPNSAVALEPNLDVEAPSRPIAQPTEIAETAGNAAPSLAFDRPSEIAWPQSSAAAIETTPESIKVDQEPSISEGDHSVRRIQAGVPRIPPPTHRHRQT